MIAALNGHALGGGLELAATADFRLCESQAKLGLPETGIGMVPGWSGTQRLVTRFGGRTVRRLALTGESVMAAAATWAERILSRGPAAVTITKQLINAAETEDRAAALEILAGALVSTTDDVREGVAAFREKRKPVFRGT